MISGPNATLEAISKSCAPGQCKALTISIKREHKLSCNYTINNATLEWVK